MIFNNTAMESIEENINNFYQEWEYYCYPDKSERCRTTVDDFLAQIDKLQEQISTPSSTQVTAKRNKRPNYSTSKARYWICYPPTRSLPSSSSTKA